MSEPTKACNLTEDEVKMLIMDVGREMDETNIDITLERMNYLNKRLKAFKEVEVVFEKEMERRASDKDGW